MKFTIQTALFLTLFAGLSVHAGYQNEKFSAKDRSEAGCVVRLANDLLNLIKWSSAIDLDDKVYFFRNVGTNSNIHAYTIYAKGKKDLEKAQFKLNFRARWTDPACTVEVSWGVKLLDQGNRNIGFQGNEDDQTVTDYLKFLYPPVGGPNADFLAETSYDAPVDNPKIADPAVLQRDISTGLGSVLLGTTLTLVPATTTSSLAKKALKRVVAPALLIDGAIRIHEANHAREAETIALAGPLSRIPLFRPSPNLKGVLRLPESYEKQLDEKADEKKK